MIQIKITRKCILFKNQAEKVRIFWNSNSWNLQQIEPHIILWYFHHMKLTEVKSLSW